jgi:hypothetical protein
MAPTANGQTNPPTLPIELINAIPHAAEKPVRNSLGIEKKGGMKL